MFWGIFSFPLSWCLAGTVAPCRDPSATSASSGDKRRTGTSSWPKVGTSAASENEPGIGTSSWSSSGDLAGTSSPCWYWGVTGAPCGASTIPHHWPEVRSAYSFFLDDEHKRSSTSIIAHHGPARRAVMSSSCSSMDCSAWLACSVWWRSVFGGGKTGYPEKNYERLFVCNN